MTRKKRSNPSSNNYSAHNARVFSVGVSVTLFLVLTLGTSSSFAQQPFKDDSNDSIESNATITGNETGTATSPGFNFMPEAGVINATSETVILTHPLFIERIFETGRNPVNETHQEITFVGNGTLMPSTQGTGLNSSATGVGDIVINTNDRGRVIISPQADGYVFVHGQVFITTEDGTENATATLYELARQNPDGSGGGTGVAFFKTNSTGQLAFLDNTVAIFKDEFGPEFNTITGWEWGDGRDAQVPESSMPDNNSTSTLIANSTGVSTSHSNNLPSNTNSTHSSSIPEEYQGEKEISEELCGGMLDCEKRYSGSN
jgi:hypothetical protein